MNIKILCKNIENNHTDFNADRLEELLTEFAEEYHKEQLDLYGVSHQRELLAFKDWFNKLPEDSEDRLYLTNETINRFIANCG
jgi:hypothetical protein|tara:strand:- start:45 stop:293 length:249 start_codon:yes stop_codon:yes gene_type:complete